LRVIFPVVLKSAFLRAETLSRIFFRDYTLSSLSNKRVAFEFFGSDASQLISKLEISAGCFLARVFPAQFRTCHFEAGPADFLLLSLFFCIKGRSDSISPALHRALISYSRNCFARLFFEAVLPSEMSRWSSRGSFGPHLCPLSLYPPFFRLLVFP